VGERHISIKIAPETDETDTAGNKQLAGQLGISVRTVQRWQKEGGDARSVARSTPGLRISVQGIATAQQRQANVRAFRERVQEQELDVVPCRVMVKVYNEDCARPRSIGPQHIGGDELTAALDALEEGDAVGAAETFGRAWLDVRHGRHGRPHHQCCGGVQRELVTGTAVSCQRRDVARARAARRRQRGG